MLGKVRSATSRTLDTTRAAKSLATELALDATRAAALMPFDVARSVVARPRPLSDNPSVPPPSLKRFSSAWAPLPREWYELIPDGGRRIQESFYENLRTTLEGTRTERGRSLVVVPARNEEACIADTLDHLLAARAGDDRIEIAVAINASTDATEERVREWAREHRSEIDLHVIEVPQPGKTNALLSVKNSFEETGAHPEWIVQVDADTRINPGDIKKLIGLAKARGQIAATGSVYKVRRDGRPLIIPTEGPTGTFRTQVLSGQFFVCRTKPWLAGYEAIQKTYPQSATEDTLLTAMFRTAGFRTGSRTDAHDVPYETLGATSMGEAKDQMTRWLTGAVQLQGLYGTEFLENIGLRPRPGAELKSLARLGAKTYVNTIMRAVDVRCLASNVRFAATLPEQTLSAARLGLIALESHQSAQEAAARADREAHYSWIPQRNGG